MNNIMIFVKSLGRRNKRFRQPVAAAKVLKAAGRQAGAQGLESAHLSVPAGARDASPFDFPASVRLEGVFRRRGTKKLGQLDGIALSELRAMGNCGNGTILELVELMRRVAAGEFSVPADP